VRGALTDGHLINTLRSDCLNRCIALAYHHLCLQRAFRFAHNMHACCVSAAAAASPSCRARADAASNASPADLFNACSVATTPAKSLNGQSPHRYAASDAEQFKLSNVADSALPAPPASPASFALSLACAQNAQATLKAAEASSYLDRLNPRPVTRTPHK
jgi:hypothetical protein